MKNLIIVFILAATAMAGVKDKDFMKMWPEYFEGLYGDIYPLEFVMDKNVKEALKPVYEALDEAIATLWWFTMVRDNEFTEEEEIKYESQIETYYRQTIHELYCKYRLAFANIFSACFRNDDDNCQFEKSVFLHHRIGFFLTNEEKFLPLIGSVEDKQCGSSMDIAQNFIIQSYANDYVENPDGKKTQW